MRTFTKVIAAIAAFAAACAAAAVLPACSQIGEDLREIQEEKDSIAYPAEYRITYERSNGDGTVTLITRARDGEGNVYYREGEEELYFYLQDGSYFLLRSENGELTEVSPGTLYTEKYVEDASVLFFDCAETRASAPGFEEAEGRTVAGRQCRAYENTIGNEEMSVTYIVLIDSETSVCLGMLREAHLGGFGGDGGEDSFICTEFATDGVVFPEL